MYNSGFYPFAIPGQPTGQWTGFDPTQGAYTYTVSSGFTVGSVWFPNLTTSVELFAGTSSASPNIPFYTTGSGGAECVPVPSGLAAVTLLAPSLIGAIMPIFVTSSNFSPLKYTPSSATVGAVTATAPLASSGGSAPNIYLPAPLPVVNGGTGTATPSPTNGPGITIAGAWPNQTIGVTIPLAVTFGGNGSSTPGISAGNAGIGIGGSWPTQAISNLGPTLLNSAGTVITNGKILVIAGMTGAAGVINYAFPAFVGSIVGAVASPTSTLAAYIEAVVSGFSVTYTSYASGGAIVNNAPFFSIVVGS